jgi:hypothetical protein
MKNSNSGTAAQKAVPTDFDENVSLDGKLKHFLQYAILAPSSHNTQPWLFKLVGDDTIEVYADQSRWLKLADADKRELFISVGCALENLLIAAEHYGYAALVDYFPKATNEDFVAAVHFHKRVEREMSSELFAAITARSTNHNEFEPTLISPEDKRRLENSCREEGIGLFLTSDLNIKRKVEELVIHADALQFADPEFRAELGHWIGEGVFGASFLIAKISQFAVTHINLGSSNAQKDSHALRSSPVLGIICSERDGRQTQVQVGQVFERIYLKATSLGLSLQPISQIVQIPELKAKLSELIPIRPVIPQQPFRLGFGKAEAKRTPRRPLEEMLI